MYRHRHRAGDYSGTTIPVAELKLKQIPQIKQIE